jgi:hypothetical protein
MEVEVIGTEQTGAGGMGDGVILQPQAAAFEFIGQGSQKLVAAAIGRGFEIEKYRDICLAVTRHEVGKGNAYPALVYPHSLYAQRAQRFPYRFHTVAGPCVFLTGQGLVERPGESNEIAP